MANITPQDIFPSAKFISTDAVGDLQEVHGLPAQKGNLIADKLIVDAVDAGLNGNNISFELVDTNRGLPTPEVPAIQEVKASLQFDGKIKIEAVNAGVAGNSLEVRISNNGRADSEPVMNVSKNADRIVIDIREDNGSIIDASEFVTQFEARASQVVKDLFSVTEIASGILSTDNLPVTSLTGGVDGVASVPAVESPNAIFSLTEIDADADGVAEGYEIVCDVRKLNGGTNNTANNIAKDFVDDASADIKALVNISTLSIQDSPTMTSHTIAKTNLTGGSDQDSNQELDSESTYLMIKTSDINDLEDTEQGDGRKVIYGLIDKANDNFSALADAPSNLKISNSNPIYNSSTNTIFKSYLIETFLSFQGLDVKDES